MASSSLTAAAEAVAAQCDRSVNVANFVSSKLRRKEKGNNYISWREQMICLMESQGLIEFIDGKALPPHNDDVDYGAWKRTDWLVKGWILGALSDELIAEGGLTNLENARLVWVALENKFSRSPPRSRVQTHQDLNSHLPLYKAAMSGDWDTAEEILKQNPSFIRARVSSTFETVLHVAVGTGQSSFVEKLVELPFSDPYSLSMKDNCGNSALHIAAATGNYRAAEILIQKLPDLVYSTCLFGNYLPLHIAAQNGHRETLELLLTHTHTTHHSLSYNPYTGESGLMLLVFLIDADFFDLALELVENYPHLASLKHSVFSCTPLNNIALKHNIFSISTHATSWERLVYSCIPLDTESQLDKPPRWRGKLIVGKFHSALWEFIKRLVPGVKRIYGKKLEHEQALRLVKCLCKHMESMRYEEASAIYLKAMGTAAKLGNHEVLETIVATFPHAVHYQDPDYQTNFLHLAVRCRSETVFNLMYQTSNYRYLFANTSDASGNSILHLAASLAPTHKLNLVSGAALQMQREIQWFEEVKKFVSIFLRGRTNNARKTAEMIFTEEHRELKIEGEKWMKDTANSCTIVAALIVTMVFAAAITVPGGNVSETGYPIFWGSSAFTIFAVSDAVSLFTSTTSLLMFLSILTSRYAEEDFLHALPKRLCIGLVTLFLSILFMLIAFSSTLYLVFGRKEAWVLAPVAALALLPVSSFVLLQSPLLFAVISSTYGRGVFGKQSDRPFH